MKERIAQSIYTKLLASKQVLILPHQRPDGDAMGAATALASFLSIHGINWKIWCKTPPPSGLMFLPHANAVRSDDALWQEEQFDTIVVVDSGDLVYNGSAEHIAQLSPRPTIINIDHHPTNQQYGDINLVIPTASSTNEILYIFFLLNREPVTGQIATSLMTGLITDTGIFTNSATSKRALSIGGELIGRGADLRLIKHEVITDKTVAGLRLWGVVMNRLTLHEPTGIVHTYVLDTDLATYNATEEDADGIANFLNFLEEGTAAMVLKVRSDGTVKGSFRTTKKDVDVSAWAKLFGGGGHVKAAGFSVEGPIEKAIEFVLETIEKFGKK
jgi:phosphoesterase RecJ-like protein